MKFTESGVKEYWIIHPNECTLIIYTLIEANTKLQGFLHMVIRWLQAVERVCIGFGRGI